MSLEVLKPGLLTSIQDGGRKGFQDRGIPRSGFMDAQSAKLANVLANNHPTASLIEMGLVGATYKVLKDICIAVYGANMNAFIDDVPLIIGKLISVKTGAIIKFSQSTNGVYGYLAISGGIDLDNYLASTSTYVPAKIGGLHGHLLQKGDVIKTKTAHCENLTTVGRLKPVLYSNDVLLKCMKGPEYDSFSNEDLNAFFSNEFTVSKDTNRIGIRLEGPTLNLDYQSEIISSGIVKGTVQITKGGQPIIMMSDAHTTGGYMRIANLTVEACHNLSQIAIGGKVFFELY
ncbi:5-oxoprolinase subunit C family protein [Wenyingzhuangia sp. IMCC45533]